MSKVKVLSFLTLGMLAINLFLIWFLLSHRPPRQGREEPKNIIIDRLRFDTQQVKEYEKLIEWHKENIRKSEMKMRELKDQLYSGLGEKNNSYTSDSLIAAIGKVQMEIENINYRHFTEIKQLCKPEQMTAFNDLCLDIAKLFAPRRPPHDEH